MIDTLAVGIAPRPNILIKVQRAFRKGDTVGFEQALSEINLKFSSKSKEEKIAKLTDAMVEQHIKECVQIADVKYISLPLWNWDSWFQLFYWIGFAPGELVRYPNLNMFFRRPLRPKEKSIGQVMIDKLYKFCVTNTLLNCSKKYNKQIIIQLPGLGLCAFAGLKKDWICELYNKLLNKFENNGYHYLFWDPIYALDYKYVKNYSDYYRYFNRPFKNGFVYVGKCYSPAAIGLCLHDYSYEIIVDISDCRQTEFTELVASYPWRTIGLACVSPWPINYLSENAARLSKIASFINKAIEINPSIENIFVTNAGDLDGCYVEGLNELFKNLKLVRDFSFRNQ